MPPQKCRSKRWRFGTWTQVNYSPCPRPAMDGGRYCHSCVEWLFPEIMRTDTCGMPDTGNAGLNPPSDYAIVAPRDRSYEGFSDWPYLVYRRPRKRTWRSQW
jgi:hypothetical protein